jgi:hypothetical protein
VKAKQYLGLLALATVLTAPAHAQTREQDEVKAAFESYKTAIMNDSGQEAAVLLSASTAAYFEQMRDLALYGSKEEIRRQSTINLMHVLTMRHRVPAERLAEMSGVTLLTFAIDQGWVGKNSVAALKVHRVYIAGSTAVADVASERSAARGQMRFIREDAGWRLDLLSVIKAGSAVLDQVAKQRGEPREDLVLDLLSATSGRQADSSIWQPPMERP